MTPEEICERCVAKGENADVGYLRNLGVIIFASQSGCLGLTDKKCAIWGFPPIKCPYALEHTVMGDYVEMCGFVKLKDRDLLKYKTKELAKDKTSVNSKINQKTKSYQ